ncbi:hypothetical protein R5W24_001372 [Gemmata sp. JC717]|uniref:Lipoprotein n=1 Tax=Gemmata algarum TaxID=2975278 RepID=A0ABU5EWJ0_9BACT|nr:hypothetical protein [Gemmata algarum]MDY3552292.1 hypothetical protein [Gemmata algarum]MDY3558827.1 hypothetical protein [Gemmata algarum]
MRALALLLFVTGAAGCGSKQDNSKIQSPSDQPIGGPKALGSQGGEPVNLGAGNKGRGAAPKVELKQ